MICALSIAAILMCYFCVTSVTTPIKFEKTRAEREVTVIKHLVDLRTAEVEYHHQKGVFTASADTLLMFLKTAPKKEVMKEGSLTDKQLEAGLTEHKAIKILNEAKKKALKKQQFEDADALYAYIWANDKDVINNGLAGFRRDTIELNMLQSLYKGEYDENSIDVIVERGQEVRVGGQQRLQDQPRHPRSAVRSACAVRELSGRPQQAGAG